MKDVGRSAAKTPIELHALALEARGRGDLAAARRHLDAAKAQDPEGQLVPVWLGEMELLRAEGKAKAANEVLAWLCDLHPGDVWVAYHQASLANQRGDRSDAWEHLNRAKQQDPDGRVVAVGLLEAELLQAENRTEEAEAVLLVLQENHPANFWAAFLLTRLARQRGEYRFALAHLATARALDPEGKNMALRRLHVDLLCDMDRGGDAERALGAIAADFPTEIWPCQRRSQLAVARGAPVEALAHIEAALLRDGSRTDLNLSRARLLIQLRRFDEAITHLEDARARLGPQPEIMLVLVQACRRAGRGGNETAALATGLIAHPTNAALLRHLFATRVRIAASDAPGQVIGHVRDMVGDALADELTLQLHLQNMEYADALTRIREIRDRPRNMQEAHGLASALFGTYRFRTGLRYLRVCLRRWPESAMLAGLYVSWGLKLGRTAEIERFIEAMADHLPEVATRSHRLMLCGMRDDLQGALDHYAWLQEVKEIKQPHRDMMAKMIFSLADPEAADQILARIGNPAEVRGRPLHRGGLPGMMTLEFDLERQALAETGGYASAADWVRARPSSTMAAIRLIDAWRGAADRGEPPQGAPADAIPRRIFQYWNTTEPPQAVIDMTESWSRQPGFEYNRSDRAYAVRFLRDTFGTDWSRAFQLTVNTAEESDFIRLCLLAHFGGVYADVDDYLCGDLSEVLGQNRGLILYRDTMGGGLGNNFIAAAPGHPVIVHAARAVCEVLLQRSVEISWSKTGPGLLARSVAHYIARTDPGEVCRQITILDGATLFRDIVMHNPISYKSGQAHWSKGGTRKPDDGIWADVLAAIQSPTG